MTIPDRSANWLRRDLVVWDIRDDNRGESMYRLHFRASGGMVGPDGAIDGGSSIDLILVDDPLPTEITARWPHLAHYTGLRLPSEIAADRDLLTEILCGQVVVAVYEDGGAVTRAAGVQLPGVLDDLFDATDRHLGITWAGPIPTVSVWAPTAVTVGLLLAEAGERTTGRDDHVPMSRTSDGVWSVTGDESWLGAEYLFRVQVYDAETDAVRTNDVTDPYSVALTTNSARSVIADLRSAELQPDGWRDLIPPAPEHPVDTSIYELHVRDFSISDPTVPEPHRGGYLAFTHRDSAGMRHLADLAAAGLNTLHLLPTFDFSTVDDRRDHHREPSCDLPALTAADPAGEAQQNCVRAAAGHDGFNWGYDPWHYSVPEGSYATDPMGARRTLEFRRMVAALAEIGLRVVRDVVYNHTVAAGQDRHSVLDRIVPGYYHRLSADGRLENSTCCPNTAAEHAMMQKLIVDSVVHWARQYKVGGFRFDLMGHHPRSTMLAVRSALDALTIADDGVDGAAMYVYGEGWNFGEVADNARFVQATQVQMAGTGIGTFNDRLRDAVRGGGPFDDDPRVQGFGTGLFTDPNGRPAGAPVVQRDDLLAAQDAIKAGLTGNLAGFRLVDRFGDERAGSEIWFRGAPAGYTAQPAEVVSYVDAHDNESLYDALALKLPKATSMADRVRMNTVCLATVALGQGPMFWHAGTDLLRSKSLDRNSYRSGDWFNRIDWTGRTNAFGSGLPPAPDNEAKWPFLRPLLADPELRPQPADIAAARAAAHDLLRLRYSSPLFRLRSAEVIDRCVTFPIGGPDQTPGVILMVLSADSVGTERDRIVVVFNATPRWQDIRVDRAATLTLHPVQVAGRDPIVRLTSIDGDQITVPPRTVAVLQS